MSECKFFFCSQSETVFSMSLLASQIFLMKKSIQSTPSNFMVFSTFNFRTMHRGIKTF